jgi:hypothetical protein
MALFRMKSHYRKRGGILSYYGTATPLADARNGLAATPIGDYALFGGGRGNGYYTIDAYNKSLVRTIPTSLSEYRNSLAATSIGNYALFGGGSYGNTAYYTVDALEKQNNAEEVKFNKNELKELLDAVTINDTPTYSMLSITGNKISYDVRYQRIKKTKTIKVGEAYPTMNIKLNPDVLKNALEIGAEYLSIDKKKIVAKTDIVTYICFIGD